MLIPPVVCVHAHILAMNLLRDKNLEQLSFEFTSHALTRKKLHPPIHHRGLRKEENLVTGHNMRHLEAMTATLLNNLQVLCKQNVRYASWCYATRTTLNVVAPTSATRVFNESKLTANSVQHAGKTTLKSILIKT